MRASSFLRLTPRTHTHQREQSALPCRTRSLDGRVLTAGTHAGQTNPAQAGMRADMKLTTLRPRIGTVPTRFQRVAQHDSTARLRGRAAVARRLRWLQAHPLCCMCEAEGRVTAATVPDHRIPLWKGGADDETNLQSLCAEHHDAKTAAEAAERAAG